MSDVEQSDLIAGLEQTDWRPPSDLHTMHELEAHFSRLAADTGEDEHAKRALEILGAICFMHAIDNDWAQPYRPAMQWEDKRTLIPSDLDLEQLNLLRHVLDSSNNNALRGRVADILWLCWPERKERYPFAHQAVDAWSRLDYGPDTWFHDHANYFSRASQLAVRLHMTEQVEILRDKLRLGTLAGPGDGATVRMSEVYFSRFSGNEDEEGFVGRLQDIANDADASFLLRREALLGAARWRLRFDHESQGYDLLREVAELWVAEAEDRLANAGSHMVAAGLLESALKQVRAIPRRFRGPSALRLVEELPRRIREYGTLALDEMARIESDPVDLQQAVDLAREAVRNREPVEALAVLFVIVPLASVAKDRAEAQEANEGSIAAVIPHVGFASDGRKTSQSNPGEVNRYGVDAGLWRRMLQLHEFRVLLVAQSLIAPALREIGNEHRLQYADFRTLVSSSAIVPTGRVDLVARGLWDGYSWNFASALHILTPQLEALVRDSMREGGLSTSGIDAEGIEQEWGLSKLMEDDQIEDLLGEDLAYEIRALFCDPVGPNLRNTVAHGLIDSAEASGVRAMYVWWLLFRLVFVPYFNRLRKSESSTGDAGAAPRAEDPPEG